MSDEIKRLPGWRSRLAAVLVMDAGKPFAWGDRDCFMGLVVPAIEAMTGQDLGAPFRGKYSDVPSAKAALSAAGFTDLAAAAAAHFPEIPVAMAHIGDLAVLPSQLAGDEGLGVGLGVVTGDRIFVLSPQGAATIKLSRASRAFRVG